VNIVGQDAPNSSLEGIRAGTEAAWVGYPLDVLGWRVIDILARHFEGEDLSSPMSVLLPSQILDDTNVDSAVFDDGFYVGVADYEQQFKSLWLVE
jgi:ribose transport system substrate-binding protein